MNAHTITQVLVVGLTAEVIYRNFVRHHVRVYLGIEAHAHRSRQSHRSGTGSPIHGEVARIAVMTCLALAATASEAVRS